MDIQIVTNDPNPHLTVDRMPRNITEAHALSSFARRHGAIGAEQGQDTPIYVRRKGGGLVERISLRDLLHSVRRLA